MTKTRPKSGKQNARKMRAFDLSQDHEMSAKELSDRDNEESLEVSETDEDENEGTGSGNLERSDDDVFKDK